MPARKKRLTAAAAQQQQQQQRPLRSGNQSSDKDDEGHPAKLASEKRKRGRPRPSANPPINARDARARKRAAFKSKQQSGGNQRQASSSREASAVVNARVHESNDDDNNNDEDEDEEEDDDDNDQVILDLGLVNTSINSARNRSGAQLWREMPSAEAGSVEAAQSASDQDEDMKGVGDEETTENAPNQDNSGEAEIEHATSSNVTAGRRGRGRPPGRGLKRTSAHGMSSSLRTPHAARDKQPAKHQKPRQKLARHSTQDGPESMSSRSRENGQRGAAEQEAEILDGVREVVDNSLDPLAPDEEQYEDGSDGAEASPFIPRTEPEQSPFCVEASVRGLDGLLKDMGHVAWTGKGILWTQDFQRLKRLQCNTTRAQELVLATRNVEKLIYKARKIREAHGDDAMEKYLNDHNAELRKHNAQVDHKVREICEKDLAAPAEGEEALGGHAIRSREFLWKDMSSILIPMFCFLTDETRFLVGEYKRGAGYSTFAFTVSTLKIFTNLMKWAVRLEFYHIDPDEKGVTAGFRESRKHVHKALAEVQKAVWKAGQQLKDSREKQKAEEERQKRQLEAQRRERERRVQAAQAQIRADHAKKQRRLEVERILKARIEREEALRREAAHRQHLACARSTQELRYAPNPLDEIWDRTRRADRSPPPRRSPELYETDSEMGEDSKRPWQKKEELHVVRWLREGDKTIEWMAQKLQRPEHSVEERAARYRRSMRRICRRKGYVPPSWARE